MKTIQRIYETKTAAGYEVPEFYDPNTDEHEVEHMLINDMIAKHYWKALYIGSIRRHNNKQRAEDGYTYPAWFIN